MAAAVLLLVIEVARLFGGFFMPPISVPVYLRGLTLFPMLNMCIWVWSPMSFRICPFDAFSLTCLIRKETTYFEL
jgi:hypothetical protein